MTDVAIRVEGLSKQYRIGSKQESYKTLREGLTQAALSPFRKVRSLTSRKGQSDTRHPTSDTLIWALKDVSFEVKQGEVMGIIGRNGAGKSTLLKILSRVTEPTEGYADIHGRVASLLEIGTGFHPELTGRENLFLSGVILGMKKAEIKRKFDEIVGFAEVEKFIDTPVKHYSSGMYLRLAFSVAAHMEPDILLVDEILAVGDVPYQKKCLGKMDDVAKEGRTVFFVSHNLAAVSSLCSQGILLESGLLTFSGTVESVIARYQRNAQAIAQVPLVDRKDRIGDGRVKLVDVTLLETSEQHEPTARSGGECAIAIDYELASEKELIGALFMVLFRGKLGQPLFLCGSRERGQNSQKLSRQGRVVCRIPRLPLQAGRYTIDLSCGTDGHVMDRISDAGVVDVVQGDFFGTGRVPDLNWGEFLVDHTWNYLPTQDNGNRCGSLQSDPNESNPTILSSRARQE